eukprot:3165674-Rhodomonas_salina.1
MQRERERVLEWGFCGKDRQREARNLNAGVCGQGMPRANLKGGGGVRTVSRWPLSVVTLLHRTVAERHSRAASGTCCTAQAHGDSHEGRPLPARDVAADNVVAARVVHDVGVPLDGDLDFLVRARGGLVEGPEVDELQFKGARVPEPELRVHAAGEQVSVVKRFQMSVWWSVKAVGATYSQRLMAQFTGLHAHRNTQAETAANH